jgi:hypothetical protein
MKITSLLCLGFFLLFAPSLKAQNDPVTDSLNQNNDWPNLRR